MIVSDNIFIKYYDKETGYGILTDGSYFWYTYWWEDKGIEDAVGETRTFSLLPSTVFSSSEPC